MKTIVMFLMALIILSAYGMTYYVAPGGSDSYPGTESQPWEHIQHAADVVVAGDTVLIREGTYNEQVLPENSGTDGNPIVYAAYPGEIPTIDGTGIPISWEGLFYIAGKSYIIVSGLRVFNSSDAGILLESSSHITIENNYTYNTVSSGIGAWDCGNIIIDNNEVELACNDGEQECISVAVTDSFEVRNNHVHHGGPGTHGAEGIDTKDGSSNGKVYDNYVHDMNRLGIYVDAWDKHTYNIEVFRNIVHDCAGDGFCVVSEAGGILENVSVYNNIAYDNELCGFTFAHYGEPVPSRPLRNIKLINNTFFNNGTGGWGGGISVESPDADSIIIRNNICSQNLSFQISMEVSIPHISIDHNLIDGYRGDYAEVYGSDSVIGNAMFTDTSIADFHLLIGSPAINNGSSVYAPTDDYDGNPRPIDGVWDIGAFEYNPGGMVNEVMRKPHHISIDIYPNPFNSSVRISLEQTFLSVQNGQTGMSDLSMTIEICNLRGRIIGVVHTPLTFEEAVSSTSTNHTFIWYPDPTLPSGMYLVRARTEKGKTIKKRVLYLK